MEEQRKKIVNGGSPLASADQVHDGSFDSSINEAIYEDEEDEEDSGEDEEHGPTTSDSEPLDLNHRRINAKRGKPFTNALSEDVLSQFIVRRNEREIFFWLGAKKLTLIFCYRTRNWLCSKCLLLDSKKHLVSLCIALDRISIQFAIIYWSKIGYDLFPDLNKNRISSY